MPLKIELEAKILRLQEAVDMLLGKPGDLFYDDRMTNHNKVRKIREETPAQSMKVLDRRRLAK